MSWRHREWCPNTALTQLCLEFAINSHRVGRRRRLRQAHTEYWARARAQGPRASSEAGIRRYVSHKSQCSRPERVLLSAAATQSSQALAVLALALLAAAARRGPRLTRRMSFNRDAKRDPRRARAARPGKTHERLRGRRCGATVDVPRYRTVASVDDASQKKILLSVNCRETTPRPPPRRPLSF